MGTWFTNPVLDPQFLATGSTYLAMGKVKIAAQFAFHLYVDAISLSVRVLFPVQSIPVKDLFYLIPVNVIVK